MNAGRLGVLTAMPEEASTLLSAFDRPAETIEHGKRVFHLGELWGVPVVVVVSRCGKVSAAATVTELIVRFGVGRVVCAGVAGGLGEGVEIGDVVIADRLVQHDLDARPLWPRHVVPLLELAEFEADAAMNNRLVAAADDFCRAHGAGRTHLGLIASGDVFVHGPVLGHRIRETLPGVLCVEMEGAAVAQVCREYGVPFAVVRTISDRADSDAPADFGASLGAFAATHTSGILSRFLAPHRAGERA